jgi:hypothetical protein
MLNTLTITPEQEKAARDQAFYLLKKYSSFTFLDKARSLYQELLDTYVRMLNEPEHAAYQINSCAQRHTRPKHTNISMAARCPSLISFLGRCRVNRATAIKPFIVSWGCLKMTQIPKKE